MQFSLKGVSMRKRGFLIIVLFFLSLSFIYGEEIIDKESLNVEKVHQLFKDAFYEVTLDPKGFLVLKDIFKIYVDLDPKNRYISFSVYFPIREDASMAERYKLLNVLNKEIILIRSFIQDSNNVITIQYYLYLENGTTPKNVIVAEKMFVNALRLVLDKDPTKIIK
jgi:hypothetical protein